MTEEKHCGCVEASIEEAYISDPLGIFGRKRTSTACGSTDILPSERAAAADSRIFSSFNSESFKYSKYRKGNDPGEIQGIRDYRIGDSPKTIHWKLSGKMDDIMVRGAGLPCRKRYIAHIRQCSERRGWKRQTRRCPYLSRWP